MAESPNLPTAPPIDRASFGSLIRKAAVYLTGDALYFFLGFLVYGWLVRILSNEQYGQLSIATSIFQLFMMVVAIGIDMVGPKYLVGAGLRFWSLIREFQLYRYKIFVFIVIPFLTSFAIYYWHSGQAGIAQILLTSLLLILARAYDISYAAISISKPGILARSRGIGMAIYLLALVAVQGLIRRQVALVVLVQAGALTLGRQLMVWELRKAHPGEDQQKVDHRERRAMRSAGLHAGGAQVLMLACNSLDSVWLGRHYPSAIVGQYATVGRLYLFGTYVLGSILNAYLPPLISNRNEPSAFAKLLRQLWLTSMVAGLVGGSLIWRTGPIVAERLAGRSLPMAHEVAPMFGLTFLVMSVCAPYYAILPAMGEDRAYLIGVFGALIILIVGFQLLIPLLGCAGAPLAQTIGLAGLGVFAFLRLRTKIPFA
jgi:O-antigen/teichoic acid export membrane protein